MPADDATREAHSPAAELVHTDVLIVGSGPAGASAALFLSTLGVDNVMVTKYRWTANTPRAHITNQRTMEIFRDVGIEDQVLAEATPHSQMGDTVFCTALAGEELGRIRAWGTHPARHGDYARASPSWNCDLPQTYLEPILVRNATVRGTRTRFCTEYVSHVADAAGVTVTVLDRLTGQHYQIRARYLVGADGARSQVAADLDLPLEGEMDVAGSMNITFTADLTALVAHRPSVLYWVIQPGSSIGGIGAGLVRMVRPWNEWLIVWGYDITRDPPTVDAAEAIHIVRSLLGMPDLDVTITGISLWGNNEQYATQLHSGRVFCVGDAVHKHPPSNGLGSNTSIQDSYNLAWKLALVLRSQAGPALLDTYTDERAPVARHIVRRANRSAREFGALLEALGLSEQDTTAEMQTKLDERAANTAAGRAKREALRQAMEIKNYEFNAHGVELGQHYTSRAVVADGAAPPEPDRDPELYYQPCTVPGARLPHAWVGDSRRRLSTHDLAPYDQFTLVTGIAGERSWSEAVTRAAAALKVRLGTVVIGPGRDVTDLYFDWAELRGIDEDGALLVRPDKHIGWRATRLPNEPHTALLDVLSTLLNRTE